LGRDTTPFQRSDLKRGDAKLERMGDYGNVTGGGGREGTVPIQVLHVDSTDLLSRKGGREVLWYRTEGGGKVCSEF